MSHKVVEADLVPPAEEITVAYDDGTTVPVTLHDGSTVLLRKADPDYDPTDRSAAMQYLEAHRAKGEVVTGLMYLNETLPEMHDVFGTGATPLSEASWDQLNPGSEALASLQRQLR
jgi:2-oxoglutarate ferredoxin oxidoreductase subunit beta